MKKCCVVLLMAALLLSFAGCRAEETLETVADDLVQPVMAQPGRISVELPRETALPAMENDGGRIYICNDYEIQVQTMEAGDLNQTVRSLSGQEKEDLTVMQTWRGGMEQYEFVWAAAGESGDQLGRALILDDGNYHYCLCVLRNASDARKTQIDWDQVFSSFCVVEDAY